MTNAIFWHHELGGTTTKVGHVSDLALSLSFAIAQGLAIVSTQARANPSYPANEQGAVFVVTDGWMMLSSNQMG